MNHHERISALQDMVWGDRGTGKTDSRDENTKENNMHNKDKKRFVKPILITDPQYVASLDGGETMLMYKNDEGIGTTTQVDLASIMTWREWLETIPFDKLDLLTLAEAEEVSIVRFK